jgi:hypothetical protein
LRQHPATEQNLGAGRSRGDVRLDAVGGVDGLTHSLLPDEGDIIASALRVADGDLKCKFEMQI